jgi:hypothetical protein
MQGRARARVFVASGVATMGALALVVACGADADLSPASGLTAPDGGFAADSSGADSGVAIKSGVVLLHAAAFPSFRLCFANYPSAKPMPDRTLMPQSNVVGVESGSAVRIDPLPIAPGMVYVFNESKIRVRPNSDLDQPCGNLLASSSLTKGFEYLEAGELTEALGVDKVSLLAITGCGNDSYLGLLGLEGPECDPAWASHPEWVRAGSLRARTLTLFPSEPPTETDLAVQLFHLSEPVEQLRGSSPLRVSFGTFFDAGADAPLAQSVGTPVFFDAGAVTRLSLGDGGGDGIFASHGFRILYGAGSDAGIVVDQTLAEVQRLSAPSSLPTTYFDADSSYALLLLGDPRAPRLIDGGLNPTFPLRSVHLLAIPIRSPEDAGSPRTAIGEGGAGPFDAAATD